ncbi:glycosyltransferase [Neobacillus sp. FSL H8-0543]|uniref:glycosyltransferase n=1 Tax=Neobacillus sp. FSL H8-0543 TaxID=2954672 RepID=UPI0031587A21
MKSILFVLEASEFGGVEKSLIDLISILKNKETKITVLSIYQCNKLEQMLSKGIEYKHIFSRRNIQINRAFKILPPKVLSNVFIRGKYDFIVAYQEGMPTKLVSGIKGRNTKRYCWQHNDPLYNDNNLYYFLTKDKLLRCLMKFDQCISVSNYIKNHYKIYLAEKLDISVIYNLIDDVNVRRLSKAVSTNNYPFEKGVKFCCIGRLSEEKNFISVISTIKKIKDKNFDVNLTIIGSGPEKSNLLKAIKTNNLEDRVKILDFVDNPYMYMDKCDVVVCSSKVESFGLVVAEAMILNKCIISTKCGGPEELLQGYTNGLLVNSVEDIDGGFYKMQSIKNTDKNNKHESITFPFSKANVSQNIVELFS